VNLALPFAEDQHVLFVVLETEQLKNLHKLELNVAIRHFPQVDRSVVI
jgi:hypothetical protein